jgi:hypothetical protein
MHARTLLAILALTLVVSLVSNGQTHPATAPVPQQIINAKKVFVSNAGMDAVAWSAFKRDGDINRPYNQFYMALKARSHYDLVATPADADLVFEIRFGAPISGTGNMTVYAPHLDLTVVDVKTHFILWTIIEPVDGAMRKATWDKNFDRGMTNLMNDLKQLVAAPAATGL